MRFNPRGLLILIGFAVLIGMAAASNGGGWFYLAEAVASALILWGVAGFLGDHRKRSTPP